MKTSLCIAMAWTALLMAGCGGLSDVGEQEQGAPLAKAVVVNHSFTPLIAPTNGTVTTTVRSGTEVIVSGKESDSDNAPIVRYEWSVANAAGTGLTDAQLVVRNSNTVSFFAPSVSEPTELTLRLTVVDANERTAEAHVQVNVEPVPDQDRFLSFAGQPKRFFVYTRLGADPPSGAGDVSFSVKVEPLLDYLDRSGTPRADEPVGRVQQQQLAWELSAIGGSADCGDSELTNPVLAFEIPALNVNDIRVKYQNTDRDRLLELRDIDSAVLKLRISLTQLSGPNLGLDICHVTTEEPSVGSPAEGAPTPAVSPATKVSQLAADGVSREVVVAVTDLLDQERARTEAPTFDTATSAEVYYDTIDPDSRKTTLSEWFGENGFVPRAANFGADAHAVYLNNFDLGFGRDMYTKLGDCDGGVERPGNCDVASIVFNYASLDGAAKRISPIVAVAMEYARAEGDSSGPRFTKFYTFAPDLRGEFVRVRSVDLDGRGEKYMPQVCIVCHAGRPGAIAPVDGHDRYAGNGDLNAGWLSWDLDSFKYSDTDQSFSGKPEDAALRSNYTRDAQQEQFRKLNYFTWLTLYKDGDADQERFRGARELIEGWYGDADKLAASGSKWAKSLPDSWDPAKTAGLPSDADEIYDSVFAQNCRACHVLHVPGTDGQVAMRSYDEFIGATNATNKLADQLEAGLMPFARMTMDRFWLPAGGMASGESAAVTLNGHLSANGKVGFAAPGGAQAVIAGLTTPLEKDKQYRLTALGSAYVPLLGDRTLWSLSKPLDSDATLAFKETLTPVLVGIDKKGRYEVTFSPPDGSEPVSMGGVRLNKEINIDPVDDVELTVGAPPSPVTITWAGGEEETRLTSVTSSDPRIIAIDQGGTGGRGGKGMIAFQSPAEFTAQNVRIDFAVVDSDTDRATGHFFVSTTLDISVNSATGYSETRRALNNNPARLKCDIDGHECGPIGRRSVDLDLRNSVSLPSGVDTDLNPLQFELEDPPAGVVLEGTNVRFLPDAAYMSQFRPASTSGTNMDPPLEVTFRACLRAEANGGSCPSDSGSATLTIQTVGRDSDSSWEQVFRGMQQPGTLENGGCIGCHGSDSPQWMGSTPANSRAVFESTCEWRSDGQPETATSFIVVPGDGAESMLWLKPSGRLNHNNADSVKGTLSLRTAIANWIADGAYFTDRLLSPQKCRDVQEQR